MQLRHRVAHVRADRVVRDVQVIGDLASRRAERDERDDLALAPRQLTGRLVRRGAPEAPTPARRAERHEQHQAPAGDDFGVRAPLDGDPAVVRAPQQRLAREVARRHGGGPLLVGHLRATDDEFPQRLADHCAAASADEALEGRIDIDDPPLLVGEHHAVGDSTARTACGLRSTGVRRRRTRDRRAQLLDRADSAIWRLRIAASSDAATGVEYARRLDDRRRGRATGQPAVAQIPFYARAGSAGAAAQPRLPPAAVRGVDGGRAVVDWAAAANERDRPAGGPDDPPPTGSAAEALTPC